MQIKGPARHSTEGASDIWMSRRFGSAPASIPSAARVTPGSGSRRRRGDLWCKSSDAPPFRYIERATHQCGGDRSASRRHIAFGEHERASARSIEITPLPMNASTPPTSVARATLSTRVERPSFDDNGSPLELKCGRHPLPSSVIARGVHRPAADRRRLHFATRVCPGPGLQQPTRCGPDRKHPRNQPRLRRLETLPVALRRDTPTPPIPFLRA